MPKLRHCPYAQTVEHGMYTIRYAANVDITEVNWQLKKKRRYRDKSLKIINKQCDKIALSNLRLSFKFLKYG